MSTATAASQTATVPVVAFDLDGTLTRADTLVPFLTSVAGPFAVMAAGARAMAGLDDRSARKERMIGAVLKGRTARLVEDHAWSFARQVIGQRLRPDMVQRLRTHLADGHEVWIVSASPALYVRPVASLLGARGAIATGLEVDHIGRLTGRFDGPNVRGLEKTRRLAEVLDGRPLEWAYGNSAGDRPMLEMARHGLLV